MRIALALIYRPFDTQVKYPDLAIGFVQEAMRLYPVTGDGTNRITTKDIWLGKYRIPKGTMVWVPFSAAFNSPHNFSRADQYVPVSFLPQSGWTNNFE